MYSTERLKSMEQAKLSQCNLRMCCSLNVVYNQNPSSAKVADDDMFRWFLTPIPLLVEK